MLKKKVKVDIYHTYVTVLIGESLDSLIESNPLLRNLRLTDESMQACMHYAAQSIKLVNVKDGGFAYYLLFEGDLLSPGILAHECLHTTNAILDSSGVDCSYDNDEACAYLLQYLVDEVYKIYTKWGCSREKK